MICSDQKCEKHYDLKKSPSFSEADEYKIFKDYPQYHQEDCFGINYYGESSPMTYNHIYPSSLGGANEAKNGILMSTKASQKKADKLEGEINGHRFKVKLDEVGGKKYGILYVDGKRVSV